MLENAYRAQVQKLIYTSLKDIQERTSFDESKIKELINRLEMDQNHDHFPIISLLYQNCLKSEGELNLIKINLIDESLLNEIEIDPVRAKHIIIEEIAWFCRNHLTGLNHEFIQIINKRKEIDDLVMFFWTCIQQEFKAISRAELSLLFESIELLAKNESIDNSYLKFKFNCFFQNFEAEPSMQREYLLKIISELNYETYIDKETNEINFKTIFNDLFKIDSLKRLLIHFQIHEAELTAKICLNYLEKKFILDQYEFKFEMQKLSLEEKAASKCEKQLEMTKMMTNSSYSSQASVYGVDRVLTRHEALEALKENVLLSKIDYLNKFLVDLWLINYERLHVYNNDYTQIEDLRIKFTSGDVIKIKDKEYSYENFEHGKHFLDSKIAKALRKEPGVQRFIEAIRMDKYRIDTLNEFLENNKDHFMSYGGSVFIYDANSIQRTANRIYLNIKMSKTAAHGRLGSIIQAAFQLFYAVVQIRYSASRQEYDGLGHFGGFANEIKYFKINENGQEFVSKNDIIKKLNELINKERYENMKFIYNDKESTLINSRAEMINYLQKFNDLQIASNNLVGFVDNENLRKIRTTKISSNKKFNVLCNNNEKDLLSKIFDHETSKLNEEHYWENNGNIIAAGTNRNFIPEKFRYDLSTIYSLTVNSENFQALSEKRYNQENELNYVTTNETLSIFELIQRFGYSTDPDRHISLIGLQDEYRTYAYKYSHEYFGGPIAVVKKVFDVVIELYKKDNVSVGDDELKKLRLLLYSHLFTAAQKNILNTDFPKFKQNYEGKKYFYERLNTKHYLDLRRYIREVIDQSQQLNFIDKFFGELTVDDFDNLQKMIKDAYESFSRIYLAGIYENAKTEVKNLISSNDVEMNDKFDSDDEYTQNRRRVKRKTLNDQCEVAKKIIVEERHESMDT